MPVSTDPVLLRSDMDGVVRLTLNRPQAYNSLSLRAAGPARGELDRIAEDRGGRVVVLAGAGKAFCAGHDLKEIAADLRDRAGARAVRALLAGHAAAPPACRSR